MCWFGSLPLCSDVRALIHGRSDVWDVHRHNVARYALGVVGGLGDNTYPAAMARRDEIATFVIRLLSVVDG